MTDSSIIQQARDVLAKWRNDSQMTGRWNVPEVGYAAIRTDDNDDTVAYAMSDANARLIVGTAGNPDLLDAIDALLADSKYFQYAALVPFAERIAAAIVAADERMNA